MSLNNAIKPEDEKILMTLEKIIGTSLPIVEKIGYDTRGVQVIKKTIIGVGLSGIELQKPAETSQFKELLATLLQLKSLQILFLGSNKLRELPESFGDLKSLEYLNLNLNQLATLPESFGNLQSLRMLDLRENELTTLPESFCDLKSLKELILELNKLGELPESFGVIS